MDTNIIIQLVIAFINLMFIILTLISVILIYKTMKSNEDLNKKSIFNEIVKQERELRIKLNEYREEIHNQMRLKKDPGDWIEISLDYDTLLFNYYEYLGICVHEKLINEKEVKKYFLDLLKEVNERFQSSTLFRKKYAKKEQYKALQWLFKKWNLS